MALNVNAAANTNLKTFAQMQTAGFQPTGTPVTAPVYRNLPQTAQNPNSLERTPKKDTIKIFNKEFNKKKTIAFAGLAIAAAATVTASILLAIKGRKSAEALGRNVQPHISNFSLGELFLENGKSDCQAIETGFKAATDKMIKRAEELAIEAQKKVDAVIEVYQKKGLDDDGKVIARISDTHGRDAEETMIETFRDGLITERKSTLISGLPQTIIETLSDGKENIIQLESYGRITQYQKGVIKAQGIEKAILEEIEMDRGDITCYTKGIQFFENKKYTPAAEIKLTIKEGHPELLTENAEAHITDGSKPYARRLVRFDKSGAPTDITVETIRANTEARTLEGSYNISNNELFGY